MTPVTADTIYRDLRATDDGTFIAWGPEGWQSARPGDLLNFGNGVLVEILTPSSLGGGSVKACCAAVLAVFVGLVVAGIRGIGS